MSVEDSETLKQQFQLIQEQQQRKLLARKQKKANNSAKETSTVSKSKNNWNFEDDLDLKLDTKIPDDEKLRMHNEYEELKQANRETKELQDKLKSVNSKMAEYRNQCESLKRDLKIAHKVLSKELGEHVNVASILNEPSEWRGRQQHISALHNKVTELKGQLHEVARCGSTISSNFLLRSSMATPSSLSSQYDAKHKSVLRKIEKDRKDTIEKTQLDLDKMTEEHSRLQQKLDASKARNKVLANEVKSVKAQIKTLLEKGAHDDELIAALMREQQYLKESKKSAPAPTKPQVIVTQDAALVNHLRQICQERERRVKELEGELESTKQNLHQEKTEKENIENRARPQTANVGCSTEELVTQPPRSLSDLTRNQLVLEENETQTFGYNKPNVTTESTNRRNTQLRNIPHSPASRNGRRGNPLPMTPPSAGRHNRGRRNSASDSEEVYVLRCQVQELKSTSQVFEVERDRG
ncbi:hypothetical protein QZH41_009042 [Actinostola sp. cb2023]|nr:hypothetical protein QZH41_009042 [Actinostola sp. cb2023]